MPNFSELFEKANWQPIEYKGNTVIWLDKLPVKNGEILLISIEKTNSDCRQGLSIDITGHCEIHKPLLISFTPPPSGAKVALCLLIDELDGPSLDSPFFYDLKLSRQSQIDG
jgi:hypothetical protein